MLLLALEEYFTSPSDDVLRRLFDTCNEIPMDGMPRLTRSETILLRSSERKDLLLEKYEQALASRAPDGRRRNESNDSSIIHSVFDRDRKLGPHRPGQQEADLRGPPLPKDTHWFDTRVEFRNIKVPIRIPMTTFDEDVGEVCCRRPPSRIHGRI